MEYGGSMYYSRQDRNYSLPVISISMICHEEPLSDVQFKAYKTRLQEYKNFLDSVNRLANCVNVCITEEPVSVGENGLLTGEALNALQHAGSISVYNFFQQHNWEYPANPEGEMAIIRPHNPVADEFLDSEQPIRPDWPAVHLTKCFVDQDKAKLHGSALPLRTYLPPTISFRNAADVDDTIEPEVRTNKQMISQEGDFEIVNTDDGIMVQKCVKEGKEAQLIPLYDFYYGRIEGKQFQSEIKAEYRFNCAACQNVSYSNVAVMQHIMSHIDEQTMKLFSNADLTNCSTCGSDFPNAFELRNHMEVEHMSVMGPDGEQQVYIDTNNGNIICTIACRICEKNCESNFALAYHLQHHHREHEMPYRCGICNFHTSLYQDVICHFKKIHCDTNQLLCPYCLRTFTCNDALPINPSDPPTSSAGQTSLYYQHVKTHKEMLFKHCNGCTLNFVNKTDFELHRRLDHKTQAMESGVDMGNMSSLQIHNSITNEREQLVAEARNDIFTKHNAEIAANISQVKKMNAPEPSRVKDLSGLILPQDIESFMCIECGDSLGIDKHRRYLPCSMCRFASCCGDAFHRHVVKMHTNLSNTPASVAELTDTSTAPQPQTSSSSPPPSSLPLPSSLSSSNINNSTTTPTATSALINDSNTLTSTNINFSNIQVNDGLAAQNFYCSRCAISCLDGNALTNHLVEECGEYMATLNPDPKLLAAREQAEREHSSMDIQDHVQNQPLHPTTSSHHDAMETMDYNTINVDQVDEISQQQQCQEHEEQEQQVIMMETNNDQTDENADQQIVDDQNAQTISIPENIDLKPQESLVLLISETGTQEFVIVNSVDIGTPEMQEYFSSRNAQNIYVLQSNEDLPE